jgi:hypothetical protein
MVGKLEVGRIAQRNSETGAASQDYREVGIFSLPAAMGLDRSSAKRFNKKVREAV